MRRQVEKIDKRLYQNLFRMGGDKLLPYVRNRVLSGALRAPLSR